MSEHDALLPKTIFDALDLESLNGIIDILNLDDLHRVRCAAGNKSLMHIKPRVINAVGYHALLRKMLSRYAHQFVRVQRIHASFNNPASFSRARYPWREERMLNVAWLPKSLLVLDVPDSTLFLETASVQSPTCSALDLPLLPQLKLLRADSCRIPLSSISHVLEVVDIRSDDEDDELLFGPANSPLRYSLTSLCIGEHHLHSASDFFYQHMSDDAAAFSQLTELKIEQRNVAELPATVHLPPFITNVEWKSNLEAWESDPLIRRLVMLPKSVTRIALGAVFTDDSIDDDERREWLVDAVRSSMPLVKRIIDDDDEIVIDSNGEVASLMQEVQMIGPSTSAAASNIDGCFVKYECVQSPSVDRAIGLSYQLAPIMDKCPALWLRIVNSGCASARDRWRIQRSWLYGDTCEATCFWIAQLHVDAFPSEQHLIHCWVVLLPGISTGSNNSAFPDYILLMLESLSRTLPPHLFRIMLHLLYIACKRDHPSWGWDKTWPLVREKYNYSHSLSSDVSSLLYSSLCLQWGVTPIDLHHVPLLLELLDDEASRTSPDTYRLAVDKWRNKFAKKETKSPAIPSHNKNVSLNQSLLATVSHFQQVMTSMGVTVHTSESLRTHVTPSTTAPYHFFGISASTPIKEKDDNIRITFKR